MKNLLHRLLILWMKSNQKRASKDDKESFWPILIDQPNQIRLSLSVHRLGLIEPDLIDCLLCFKMKSLSNRRLRPLVRRVYFARSVCVWRLCLCKLYVFLSSSSFVVVAVVAFMRLVWPGPFNAAKLVWSVLERLVVCCPKSISHHSPLHHLIALNLFRSC